MREAVVLARRDARGDACLAAYAVPADPVGDTAADRQAFADLMADELAARLPEYLVPRAWAVLPSLPTGGNGKLDRAALPAPASSPAYRRLPGGPRPLGRPSPGGRTSSGRTSSGGCGRSGPPSSAPTPTPSGPTPRSSTSAGTRSPRSG
ncbi:hypothetical protein ACFQ2B_29125 [Streptomyces stramineus]